VKLVVPAAARPGYGASSHVWSGSEAEDLGLSIRVRFTPQIGRRRTGTLTVIQLENYC